MNYTEQAQTLAQRYCNTETYEHVKRVVLIALELSTHYDADKEVISIAAWLHDIGRSVKDNEHHPVESVTLAQELLHHHPHKALIEECILHHGGKFIDEKNPIEVKILQAADGASFYLDEERITKTVLAGKLEKRLAKTSKKASVLPEGEEYIKKKYEELKKLIK